MCCRRNDDEKRAIWVLLFKMSNLRKTYELLSKSIWVLLFKTYIFKLRSNLGNAAVACSINKYQLMKMDMTFSCVLHLVPQSLSEPFVIGFFIYTPEIEPRSPDHLIPRTAAFDVMPKA